MTNLWWKYKQLRYFLRQELNCNTPVPLARRAAMLSRGFLGESYYIYGRNPGALTSYLSDYARIVRTPFINGRNSCLLDDKLLFFYCFCAMLDIPRNLALIDRGTCLPIGEQHGTKNGPAIQGGDSLLNYCRDRGGVVFKLHRGGAGSKIRVLRHDQDRGFLLNGKPVRADDFKQRLSTWTETLACEYVSQAEFSRTIFPDSTNTIRLLTMIDPDTGESFAAAAVHRFGNRESAPVDNWAEGGFTAKVDMESGELGPGLSYPKDGHPIPYEVHPDSGERIQGVTIPGWATIRDRILAVAQSWSIVPYVGWDIVVTDQGFKVIEGNNFSGVHILQIHEPLLSNPRVRRFYEYHKVIRPKRAMAAGQ